MTRTVTAIAEALPIPRNVTIVIDPGHGGGRRRRDLLHRDPGEPAQSGDFPASPGPIAFFGLSDQMIRTTDTSVYTNGATISEKKISDLKHRVEMVNETADALLLSIHQNQFSDGRYSGAQVFFAPTQGSQSLAEQTQALLISSLNPGSKRACKPAESVYLMQHIRCTGIWWNAASSPIARRKRHCGRRNTRKSCAASLQAQRISS